MARFDDYSHRYQKKIEAFRTNKDVSEHTRELILRFLRDCELGKTISRGKKKIGARRCYKILQVLIFVNKWIGKDYDKITQEDMETYILKLEKDYIRKPDKTIYSDETKAGFKAIIRKFYKWYLGGNKVFPEIVEWIDISVQDKEVPALTKKEVDKAIETCPLTHKIMWAILFDGGFRIGESCNTFLLRFSFFL